MRNGEQLDLALVCFAHLNLGDLVEVEVELNARGRNVLKGADIVMEQIEKLNKCRAAFPSSYYRKVGNGDRYGEPILKEIAILKDIIGKHYQDMLKQDMRNKESTMQQR